MNDASIKADGDIGAGTGDEWMPAGPGAAAATAEAVCDALVRVGARHVFGVPGTQSVPLYEALRRSGLRAVVPTHELAAAFMAGAYNRAGGGPGVLTTIPGPGLAYTIAGLAEARLDSAAIVYIVNGAAASSAPGFGPQALDQRALLGPVTKARVAVSRLDRVEEAVKAAWHLALDGEPGPVVLELAAHGDGGGLEILRDTAPAQAAFGNGDASRAWRAIAASRRPVIVAGQGALDAAEQVNALAQALGAPVLTTPSARGIVPETHRLAMGFDVLKGGLEEANRLIAASDAVLILGAKLAHNGSAGGRLSIPQQMAIRVDSSASVMAATYPAAHMVVMYVADFLAMPEASGPFATQWTHGEIAVHRARMRAAMPAREPWIAGVPGARFMAALSTALPAGARLVSDTGLHQVMARRYMDFCCARALLMPSDLQSMGFGLPAAIASRLADPATPVVALVGDGGLRMSGLELATAVREKLDMTIVVINDRALGQIRMQQLSEYGTSSGTEIGDFDVAALAQAVGADYARVERVEGLGPALRQGGRGVRIVEVPAGDTIAIRAAAAKARVKSRARAALGSGISARVQALIRGRG
jgi:acetolactate synthase-1/2/3 large subunit